MAVRQWKVGRGEAVIYRQGDGGCGWLLGQREGDGGWLLGRGKAVVDGY